MREIKSPRFVDDIKLLLTFDALHKVTNLFIGTFLVSFIMQTSINEILSVSLYQMFYYVALISGFVLLGNWVKRKNKSLVFALNVIPKAALLIAVIVLKGDFSQHVIPLGFLAGLAAAFYWAPMHNMISEKISPKNMTKFSGYKAAIGGSVKIIAPILLGIFITVGSYVEMAWAMLAVCGVELILMFFLKPSIHRSKYKLDLHGFFHCMMRFPVIRKLFSIEVLRGFSPSGVLGTVITMYTVYMFKTDLNLGIFTTIFAVFSILVSFLFGRYGSKKMFPKILFACSLASLTSLGLFVMCPNELTFLFYNFIYVTAISLLGQIAEVNVYNLSNSKCVNKNTKTEYFIFREIALGVGRYAGYLMLAGIALFGGYEYLRYFLIVLTIAILLIGYWSIRINKHIRG